MIRQRYVKLLILALFLLAPVVSPVSEVEASTAYVATSDVNYRTGPGTNYYKIGSISRGTTVLVTRMVEGWYEVELDNGGVAYIYSKYLVPAGNYQQPRYNSQPSYSNDEFAAMAYSYSSGNYGYGYNYDTQYEAEQRALRECKSRDCQIVVWVKNGCLSLAANNRGGIGTGWAAGSYDAENNAIYDCGGGCWIVETVCTD